MSGDERDGRAERCRAGADGVAVLARGLARLVDLPTSEELAGVLAGAGWDPGATGRRDVFVMDGVRARVRTDWTTATVSVVLAELGSPGDLEWDDFDDAAAYHAAVDRLYDDLRDDAEAMVSIIVDRLALEPADPLALDPRADYGSRVRLRAGHWAVTVAAVQEDTDLPLTVEVDLTYGADLPGRLAQLTGPVPCPGPVDWPAVSARIGVELPEGYRWLMEQYGPGTFDGYLTFTPPAALPRPAPGPLAGVLRIGTAWSLPVATTADGVVVSLLGAPNWNDAWHGLRITGPDTAPWDVTTGLLYFLVLVLSGKYPVPQFPPTFPNASPRFSATPPTT
ncbi:hypothetical protein [Dactylosporangium sp. NPDC005555]|uniref:hypothetical protein n=1 Tax=Dactylosporangium sp. NPDC005555 TaxID=3154889 RepID=UPI0033BD9744